jgi:hypothetical protein
MTVIHLTPALIRLYGHLLPPNGCCGRREKYKILYLSSKGEGELLSHSEPKAKNPVSSIEKGNSSE